MFVATASNSAPSSKPASSAASRVEPDLEEEDAGDEDGPEAGGWDDDEQGWVDDWGDMEVGYRVAFSWFSTRLR